MQKAEKSVLHMADNLSSIITSKVKDDMNVLRALCVLCGDLLSWKARQWLCCLMVGLSACLASASTHKIGPDLYAYISDNDASANSTFLASQQGILVVDTGLNAQEGRKLLAEIRKVSQAPVRWIVNTHYH